MDSCPQCDTKGVWTGKREEIRKDGILYVRIYFRCPNCGNEWHEDRLAT